MKKDKSYHFTFSQKQLVGIVVLCVFVALGVFLWRVLPYFNQDPIHNDIAQDTSWQEFKEQQKRAQNSGGEYSDYPRNYNNYDNGKRNEYTAQKPAKLFPFNPNTATEADFINLGLSPKVAATILKYRSKGGVFYKKEDFGKIYTLRPEDYTRLLPYINIPQQDRPNHSSNYNNSYNKNYSSYSNYASTKTDNAVSLNTCTQEQLMQLRGIGAGYSSRIIKYRDILGGFTHIEQVKEVYGMTDSLYDAIKDKLVINPAQISKININTATEEVFYQHPYIRKMAKNIILYRNDIGKFSAVEEFRQVPLINEEKYRKIAPYLTL